MKNFTIKKLMDAEPGELLQLTIRKQAALAFVIRKTAYETYLGVLDFPERARPFIAIWGGNHECLSYGKGWIIKPIVGKETWLGNDAAYGSPGVIHFDVDLEILKLDASSEGAFGGAIDLATLQDVSIPYNALPVASWDLWTSRESLDAGDAPLFSFGTARRPHSGTGVGNG
ncbi:hypothetical protein HJB77_27210 [Rhizobium lentis]|uniref:hypothetical protein n=1 Tax=Rhizobium lentis TaxID=1138194 RepID=UPI001C83A58B|nr:hypothetical protein [Rhizobium lentis]MBX5179912.1 hypothetical protein [Rhizobium lentis]